MFDPQLPPINVVVQNPPGMSEWAKTLLSASVGAVFGIVGSVFMEYAKPFIQRLQRRDLIKRQLNDEFMKSYTRVMSAKRAIEYGADRVVAEKGYAVGAARNIIEGCKRDRYDMYFESDKETVYEFDKNNRLADYYQELGSEPKRDKDLDRFLEPDDVKEGEFNNEKDWLERVVHAGSYYATEHNHKEPTETTVEEEEYITWCEAQD